MKNLGEPDAIAQGRAKSRPDDFPQIASRPEPLPDESVHFNQRTLDFLCEALLSAELVAPQKQLPLFQVVALALFSSSIVIVPIASEIRNQLMVRRHGHHYQKTKKKKEQSARERLRRLAG
ncbi:hypothetical protein Nepgr_008529 [Nepenthes gracilis]|uniref:Uncharacterized protein n=1 Tax=Nepenthes gracilis TaxID=150966 RepID=A0AAD3XJC6_NEPGR|nr:hypothetical protein Nepgr_008529 [Nepenthes gracilis]